MGASMRGHGTSSATTSSQLPQQRSSEARGPRTGQLAIAVPPPAYHEERVGVQAGAEAELEVNLMALAQHHAVNVQRYRARQARHVQQRAKEQAMAKWVRLLEDRLILAERAIVALQGDHAGRT